MAEYAADAPADGGQPADELSKLATYWISELDAADRDPARQKWVERCENIIKIYRDENGSVRTGSSKGKKRFALFWSSIQTVAPAVYARTPTAVVSRRWRDSDMVGRLASEVLERSLNFSLDSCDFNDVLLGCRDDYLLLAQGTAWVRYVPTMRTVDGQAQAAQIAPDPEAYEVVDWEDVEPDWVHYKDFLHNPARKWKEVRWVARRAFMTRPELVARFPQCGAHVPLNWAPDGSSDAPDDLKKAAVYEIWDRTSGKAIWVCKDYSQQALDARPDPLKLKGFFPCPRPLLGTVGPDSLVPTPDYIYWQDQADEINNLTARIDKLIDALRARGFYNAASGTDLNTLLKSDDNTLIPVESFAVLEDQGGLKGLVDWFPVQQIAEVLKSCFDARRQLINDVFQITGISDIQRGASDPNETATAQGIKASWGSLRVRDRQKELARFARDIIRIMAEVIASRFDAKVLAAMTGVQLLTAEDKQRIIAQQQAQAAAAQQAQQPPVPGAPPVPPPPPMPPIPPQMLALVNLPTWEDVLGILRNPALRAFRIDIETDSTIEPDDQEEKQRRVEFVTAIGQYLANSLPVVQANPAILPVISQGLLFLVRGFRVGREMEDVIERAMDELQQSAQQPQAGQQPNPVDQAKGQAAVLQGQAAMGRVQVEAQRVASDHAVGMGQIQAENNRTMAEAAAATHATIARASAHRLAHEINNNAPMQVQTQ